MSCQLEWIVSPWASAAYAAVAVLDGGQPADASRAAAIGQLVDDLSRRTGCRRAELVDIFRHLVPLAGHTHHLPPQDPAAWVERGLGDRAASDGDGSSEAVVDFWSAYQRQFPELAEQLQLRRPVWEENWSARGPGLLSAIGRFTEPGLIVPRARVFLVDPLMGGGGAVYPADQAVAIEGVLANPWVDLPEVVRLAWLLGQLQAPAAGDRASAAGDRRPPVVALAMLPATLQAAELVELAGFSLATIERAMEVWQIAIDDRGATARRLWEWWQQYRRQRPPWQAAVESLQQRLG
ncbi:MAG: hypothetical protein GTO03_05700 [Planctomycetales bacterium]|nr:hypothetical protein [Planctomycetales bacterium]